MVVKYKPWAQCPQAQGMSQVPAPHIIIDYCALLPPLDGLIVVTRTLTNHFSATHKLIGWFMILFMISTFSFQSLAQDVLMRVWWWQWSVGCRSPVIWWSDVRPHMPRHWDLYTMVQADCTGCTMVYRAKCVGLLSCLQTLAQNRSVL